MFGTAFANPPPKLIGMDREISADIVTRRRLLLIVKIAAVVVVIAFVAVYLPRIAMQKVHYNDLLISRIDKGSVEVSVPAKGKLVPLKEQSLTIPVTTRLVDILIFPGNSVRAGESVLALDATELTLLHKKTSDEFLLIKNRVKRQQLDLQKRNQELQDDISALALKVETLEADLTTERHLNAIGGSSDEKVKRLELDLSLLRMEQEKSRRRFDLDSKSAEIEMESLMLEVSLKEQELDALKRQLEMLKVQSPFNGVVTYTIDQVGSIVSAGQVVAKVADLSGYKVEGQISESYADRIIPGMEVLITVRDSIVGGRLVNLSPMVKSGMLTFSVIPNNVSNRYFLPNMIVDLSLVSSKSESTLRMKNFELYNGPGIYELFVVRDNYLEKQKVKLGGSSYSYIEVVDGLTLGDEVVIKNMKAFNGVGRLRLRR